MIHRPKLKQTDPKEWRLCLQEGNSRLHVTSFLAQQKRNEIPDHFSGTGCVMCAGGPMYLREAYVSISKLRSTGWNLPVQVWHIGPKELQDFAKRFKHLDVEFVDSLEVRKVHPARQLWGWELKSYAVQWSPFQNVLLLDADCAPVKDPSACFDSEEYNEYGAIMWPDIHQCRADDKVFGFLGVRKPPGYWEVESGQMMIDKVRCWRAWELVRWMNEFSEFWYRYIHGDKSTFDLSFLRTDTPYLLAPPCTWEGWGISQKWLDGTELFQHKMMLKRGVHPNPEDAALGAQFDRWDG